MRILDRRTFLKRMGQFAAAASIGAPAMSYGADAAPPTPATPKLNFVFFLIDDMGWRDTSCYGSAFYETPHIDALAGQGVRFTNAYAACCVCSPTRASILTGKYPARLQLTDWIPGHNLPNTKLKPAPFHHELPMAEITLAEALKDAGYVSAHIGKWHLGAAPFDPRHQGFDLNIGGDQRGQPPTYFYPYGIPSIHTGDPGEYLTDRLAGEALRFIDANKDRPFFLYLPHYAVHAPIEAKQPLIEKFQAKAKAPQGQNNAKYAAMIASVDESVGRVMAKLDDLGIADRTVVIFMSDNGGVARTTSNAPLRAGKGTLYEGGIREPMIIRWPGVAKPGTVCDVPVTSVDFFPTMIEMAGVTPGIKDLDGVSLAPLLRGTGNLERDALYWHYPHYHPGGATPCGAIRRGNDKLIEFYEDNHVELYDLAADLGETKDLAAKMPEKAAELRKQLQEWRTRVNAEMPTPNPEYRP